jgi:hypothetical protein
VLVLERYRAGVPIVALGAMEPPPPIDQVLHGIVWQGLPTLAYGDGGIGKSQMALAWASAIHTGTEMAGLKTRQANALFLDWETSSTMTWHRNAGLLKAAGVEPGPWLDTDHPDSGRTGMLWYRFMSGPIWDSTEFLKAEVARLGIRLVVVDSAGPACGGEPESAAATSSDYALHHRKSNVGNLNDPIGMRLSWGDNGCTIEPLNVRKHAKLRDGLNLVERVGIAISEHGGMSTGDLADLLDAPNRSLSATLSGDDRFVSQNGKWETVEPLGVE